MLKLAAALLLLIIFIGGCVSPATPAIVNSPIQQSGEATPGNQIGDLAIDFRLRNLEGDAVSLSNLRGKPVLINFWATWCPPCRGEMPFLQKIYDIYSDQGLEVLEIDIGESAATIQQYMTANNLVLPVLIDSDRTVALDYGVTVIPLTFLVDQGGVIQWKIYGAVRSVSDIEQELHRILP
jgi:peroxiredoxin